jgi:hypothetical protein
MILQHFLSGRFLVRISPATVQSENFYPFPRPFSKMPQYYLKSVHGRFLPHPCNSSGVTSIWLCLAWSTAVCQNSPWIPRLSHFGRWSHPRVQEFWAVCQGRNLCRDWLTSVWSEDDQRRISVIISVNLWCPGSLSLLVCSTRVFSTGLEG